MEAYRERLKEWNNSGRYHAELDFLYSLLDIKTYQKVLDYGCGIGTAVKKFRGRGHSVYGYDKYNYLQEEHEWYKSEFYFNFDKIYMMHSIAHIENISEVLSNLRMNALNNNGRLYVITPNVEWLTLKNDNKNVKSDATVIRHFSSISLRDLFINAGYRIIMQGQLGDCILNEHERLFLIAEK